MRTLFLELHQAETSIGRTCAPAQQRAGQLQGRAACPLVGPNSVADLGEPTLGSTPIHNQESHSIAKPLARRYGSGVAYEYSTYHERVAADLARSKVQALREHLDQACAALPQAGSSAEAQPMDASGSSAEVQPKDAAGSRAGARPTDAAGGSAEAQPTDAAGGGAEARPTDAAGGSAEAPPTDTDGGGAEAQPMDTEGGG